MELGFSTVPGFAVYSAFTRTGVFTAENKAELCIVDGGVFLWFIMSPKYARTGIINIVVRRACFRTNACAVHFIRAGPYYNFGVFDFVGESVVAVRPFCSRDVPNKIISIYNYVAN